MRLTGCFCSLFFDVWLCSSSFCIRMQRHASAQMTRCSQCWPLTLPWSSRSRIRSKTPLFHVSSNAAKLKSWDDQRVAIIHSPSVGLFCIPDLQPDWISHPHTHLCANVTLTSLKRRCHSLLASSLFPICHFFFRLEQENKMTQLRGWILRIISTTGIEDNSGLFPAGEMSNVAFGCKSSHYVLCKQQPSIIFHLLTASGRFCCPENTLNGVLVQSL